MIEGVEELEATLQGAPLAGYEAQRELLENAPIRIPPIGRAEIALRGLPGAASWQSLG